MKFRENIRKMNEKKYTKKVISVLACAAIISSLMPQGVNAEEIKGDSLVPNIESTITNEEPTYNKTLNIFFANAKAITIEAGSEGNVKISWDGKSLEVPETASIVGGYHNNDTSCETSITMNSGKVKNIIAGGLHKSHVTKAKVVVNEGATITGGIMGGGASSFKNNCGCENGNPWYNGDAKESPCKVDETEVIVNGGTITMIYGGGEGISYTEKAKVSINGGSVNYVTAGGSNGYTGEAKVSINDGTIKEMQSVNRGSMDSSNMEITGGTIGKLYVGGADETDVTGSIASSSVSITGKAEVTTLDAGKSGGNEINSNTTDVTTNVYFDKNCVEKVDGSENQDNIFNTQNNSEVIFKVDGKEYKTVSVTNGNVIKEPEEPTKSGYKFEGWYKDGVKYNFETKVNENITLEAKFSVIAPSVPSIPSKPSKPVYTHEKIEGLDRYETAGKVADELGSYDTAVLVNATSTMSDGLSAAGLAGKEDAAILLVKKDSIPKVTMDRLKKVKKVYIIGGENAISKKVSDEITKNVAKVEIERLGGKTRVETSELVAKEIGDYSNAFVVNGFKGEADAMSASPVAARYEAPILLTNGKTSNHAKKSGVKYYVVGGNDVVNNTIVDKYDAERLAGKDRYETNREVIDEFYSGSSKLYIANGDKLVDALTASPLAKNDGIVLVNEKSDKSILKDKNTVQVGGMNFEIEFEK